MDLFKDMLKSDESLFKNELALDYEYLPKLLPFREQEQRKIAACIQPLFLNKNGRNLFIYGAPGIGKTAAARHVLKEVEEKTDEIITIYINCWKRTSTFKIILEMCEALDYKLTHNKRTDELFEVVKQILNKKSVVFVFDEIDKVEDFDFLYMVAEEIYRKAVLLITNHKEWLSELDERVKSRLILETVEFMPYNPAETKEILKQRISYAFVPNVWEKDAFELVAGKASELGDMRVALYIVREAGNSAENESSKKIKLKHAEEAISKLDDFSVKKQFDLSKEEQDILKIIKENSGKKIGDLFKIYQEKGGLQTYKTFQRKIEKLEDNKFISVKKTEGGKDGNTSIVSIEKTKKLSEF